MKKIICILVSLVFIFGLVSCNSENPVVVTDPNAGYSIEKEDGNYYLKVDKIYSESGTGDSLDCEVAPAINFDSVKEMRDNVLGGKLTDEQKKTMAKFAKDENGKIKILDFNNLYEPQLPSDHGYMSVSWNGGSYYFGLKEGGYFDVINDSTEYEKVYQSDYIDFIQNNPRVEITEIKTVDDRDATEYYHKTVAGEFKSIYYKIELNNGEISIREDYKLYAYEETGGSADISDTIPYRAVIFGYMNGGYFRSSVNNLTERPSVEWLSSFGVEPLKAE